ncbi:MULTISPECIES: flagellar protein MotY [Vibrio]|jgi:outer membrane protein OmpA-like peptidoglycan-associated protein|uniref:Flagellar protein MotY n=1 Tax=Vibrio diazotrophicus TaxID=685 RepID=A0A2J8I6E6_VIBDI|nr:OmpA family protein [Vibrio diazotrophicus]MCZ4373563.1 OmpA family protein [Vibrio diazotrophicus]PNH77804.1 flagellar protein MotY [Vibrio diazotrophicus]PNH97918.1 flagellar protein MotY [Vibrio diazotrophicus]PNI06107.1 flagellar protein MotY [Vibrio diazotrophicus]RAS67789.1 outer membrane protein OmpA-like peptidoglycan-associated protein [Vibrio diazotrophicus]
MNKWLVTSLAAATLLTPVAASALEKRYVATPQQSTWQMVANTPLECRLVHPIPNYGDAEFSARASKKMNLDFELKMRRPMGDTRNVSLVSMPPAWRPGESADRITNIQFFKQFDGYIGGQSAWTLLSELEKGRYPTFSYQDWQSRDQRIEVALSSVLFQAQYNVFSDCIANLLPYSFEDISFTILHYDRGNSVDLNKASQKRLEQIAEYIRYNKDIDLVLVAAYTDSADSKNESQSLSEKRSERLRNYFKSLGLPEDRIQVQGFGKRRPIADNESPIGKDKNRRVVISLGRTQI